MGFKETQQHINKLLETLPIPAQQPQQVELINYEQIRQEIIKNDLADEREHLNHLLANSQTEEELKSGFKKLCADRYQRNKDTYLSYTAMPDGVCNKLYWDIANRLFEPASLQELLPILMPDIKAFIDVELDLNIEDTTKKSDNVNIKLEQRSLDKMVGYPPTLGALSTCVVGDGVILPIAQIAKMPFNIQQKLHKTLDKYPTLKINLYTHNDDFKKLATDISLIEETGMTAMQMFNYVITELKLSGERLTGTHYAALGASIAAVNLRSFIDRVPNSESILKLNAGSENSSVEKILEHLAQGNCVEQAADCLTNIRDNAANKDTLSKGSVLLPEQINTIKRSYGKTALDEKGTDISLQTPTSLSQRILGKIKIESLNELIILITNLSPTEYDAFCKANATFRSYTINHFQELMEITSAEQKTALVNAIVNQVENINSFKDINNFKAILDVLNEQKKNKLMNDVVDNKKNIAFKSPENLIDFLVILPEEKYQDFFQNFAKPFSFDAFNKYLNNKGINEFSAKQKEMLQNAIRQQESAWRGSDTQNNAFLDAVKKGDEQAVEALINNTNIHYRGKEPRTALYYALFNGHDNIANLLLEKGANASDISDHIKILFLHEKSKVNINFLFKNNLIDDESAKSTLYRELLLNQIEKNKPISEILFSQIDKNCEDENGNNIVTECLCKAILKGNVTSVESMVNNKFLTAENVSQNYKNPLQGDISLLALAINKNNIEIVKLLLNNGIKFEPSVMKLLKEDTDPKIKILMKLANYIDKRDQKKSYTGIGSVWMSMTHSSFFSTIHPKESKVPCAKKLYNELLGKEPHIENTQKFTNDPTVIKGGELGEHYAEAKKAYRSP